MSVPLSAVPHWLQWVFVLIAVLVALVGGIRAVPPLWKFVHRAVGLVDALAALPQFLEKNDPIIDQLQEQIVNSHGKVILRHQLDEIQYSMKRLEPQVGDALERLDRVEEGVAGLYTDQQELSDRFDKAEDTWTRNQRGRGRHATPDAD